MKRRQVLRQSVVGAVSAVVFTATGWLMGARTLTMDPPPWTTYQSEPCANGLFDCGCRTNSTFECVWSAACPDPGCRRSEWETYKCCFSPGTPWCETRYRLYSCGTCSPCPH